MWGQLLEILKLYQPKMGIPHWAFGASNRIVFLKAPIKHEVKIQHDIVGKSHRLSHQMTE